ncbi:MAG: hypothetical protein WBE26_13415 [Phycisphaerae bacterium]
MVQKIRSGNDILHAGGLPNVKLARSTRGERVLFDGHHSTLAHIACGRTFLDEIPHLEVYGEGGFVTDQDILAFFGPHSIKIRHRPEDWRHLVVNWQTSEEKQLCGRIQGNMGELFDSLFERQAWELQGGMASPRGRHGARRSTSPALPVHLRMEGDVADISCVRMGARREGPHGNNGASVLGPAGSAPPVAPQDNGADVLIRLGERPDRLAEAS